MTWQRTIETWIGIKLIASWIVSIRHETERIVYLYYDEQALFYRTSMVPGSFYINNTLSTITISFAINQQ